MNDLEVIEYLLAEVDSLKTRVAVLEQVNQAAPAADPDLNLMLSADEPDLCARAWARDVEGQWAFHREVAKWKCPGCNTAKTFCGGHKREVILTEIHEWLGGRVGDITPKLITQMEFLARNRLPWSAPEPATTDALVEQALAMI